MMEAMVTSDGVGRKVGDDMSEKMPGFLLGGWWRRKTEFENFGMFQGDVWKPGRHVSLRFRDRCGFST